MKKRYILTGLLILAGLYATKQVARANYEQPQYKVTSTVKDVEIREYQPFLSAQVRVTGEMDSAMSGGFRRLAGYIFGGNEKDQKIAMTSPVMLEEGSDSKEFETMTFIMPSQYQRADLPKPKDEGITFVENPAKTMAALRFSGNITPALWKKKCQELLDILETSKYEPSSVVSFFGYDPPVVPGALRRNEVVVEVKMRQKP